ncbi:MAG: TetR/AcrR family transcriptional regulator [Methanoregula sp.]|nr:TetR/AcrR family transcriptional regulator [Methanoregula sp.]
MMKQSEEKRMNHQKPAKVSDNETEKFSGNREKILATALTLFTERGFFGTPTSLISKEAGVATGTLFFYFATKEELIDTLYRRIKGEAAQVMCRDFNAEKTALAKLRRIGYNAVVWGIENPAKQKFMEQFAHSPFVSTTAHEEGMSHFLFLQDLVRDGIREGTIRNIDPGLLFCMMASSFSGLIARAYAENVPEKREQIIYEGLDFIFNGMKA